CSGLKPCPKSEDSQWSAAGQLSQPSDVYSSTSAAVRGPLVAEHAGSAARAAKVKAKASATAIVARACFDFILVLRRRDGFLPYSGAWYTQLRTSTICAWILPRTASTRRFSRARSPGTSRSE